MSVLAPLHPSPPQDFRRALHNLADETAQLGLSLLAVRDTWSAVWTPGVLDESRDLVVFPGLELQGVGNERTRRLAEPSLERDVLTPLR